MNDLVRNSIESRKSALFNAYDIKEQSILEKIEDLFNRINEFGESCSDSTDFETKFASSNLNQEYISLFTQIATTCSAKNYNEPNNSNVKSDEQYVKEEVASELGYELDEATRPLRRELRQEVYDEIRDIPGVGDALNIKQHIDFFGRFKKKNK